MKGKDLLRKAFAYTPNPEAKVVRLCSSSAPTADVTLAMAYLASAVKRSDVLNRFIDYTPGSDRTLDGIYVLHNLLVKSSPSQAAYYAGVQFWHTILDKYDEAIYELLFDAAAGVEDQRKKEVEAAIVEKDGNVLIVNSIYWGFDIWYKDCDIVVQYNPDKKKILVGVKNYATSKKLFPQGLGKFLAENFGPGWGGHSYLGGSPADEPQEWETVKKVVETINIFLG